MSSRSKPWFRAELKGSGPYRYYDHKNEALPGDPPIELHGSYDKMGVRGLWRRQIVREIDLEGNVKEVILRLQELSEGLDGAYLDIEMRNEPYSDTEYPHARILGSRDATPEEVEWIKKQEIRDAELAEQTRLEQIKRLQDQLARLNAE